MDLSGKGGFDLWFKLSSFSSKSYLIVTVLTHAESPLSSHTQLICRQTCLSKCWLVTWETKCSSQELFSIGLWTKNENSMHRLPTTQMANKTPESTTWIWRTHLKHLKKVTLMFFVFHFWIQTVFWSNICVRNVTKIGDRKKGAQNLSNEFKPITSFGKTITVPLSRATMRLEKLHLNKNPSRSSDRGQKRRILNWINCVSCPIC